MTGGLGLAQAFHTLTIIPVPGRDARTTSTQLYFYPFVGLFIRALGAGAMYAVLKLVTVTGLMAVVLGVVWACYMAFITRGFHLDGLGDMADGSSAIAPAFVLLLWGTWCPVLTLVPHRED